MELELKHLAPYLPYKLFIWYEIGDRENVQELSLDGLTTEEVCILVGENGEREWVNYDDIKPILRPLSDLTKEIEPLRKNYFTYTSEGFMFKGKNECYTRLSDLDFLFKNHFDVFGLIEKGLAIDINTTKE